MTPDLLQYIQQLFQRQIRNIEAPQSELDARLLGSEIARQDTLQEGEPSKIERLTDKELAMAQGPDIIAPQLSKSEEFPSQERHRFQRLIAKLMRQTRSPGQHPIKRIEPKIRDENE